MQGITRTVEFVLLLRNPYKSLRGTSTLWLFSPRTIRCVGGTSLTSPREVAPGLSTAWEAGLIMLLTTGVKLSSVVARKRPFVQGIGGQGRGSTKINLYYFSGSPKAAGHEPAFLFQQVKCKQ